MKDPNWKKCLLCGNSKDIIKRIPDNSIDFILTDPPYNIGKHSTGNIPLPGRSAMNNDVADWDWVDFNPEEWADEFIRILKPTGNLFIFTSYNQIGRWYNCLDHKFDTTNFMVWHKTNPAPKIFKAGFLNSCEMIFTCWNKKHTWNFISQAEMHNFLESPICMRPERLSNPKHPAQKPVSILKKMIEIASHEGDIIFDPFMGVGSMGVAALELNRRFIGVEIDSNYFNAAKNRIEKLLNNVDMNKNIAEEPTAIYQSTSNEINKFFNITENLEQPVEKEYVLTTTLQPIIKWAGGKEKELKYILPNLPYFENFFEPFVGGGSVFTAIKAKRYFVNDLSDELIALYTNISNNDQKFYIYTEAINNSWINAKNFFDENNYLIELYLEYRNNIITKTELKENIKHFCINKKEQIVNILDTKLQFLPSILVEEMKKNLFRKLSRMRDLELEKGLLPDKDIRDNIETAIKSALYMNFRYLYNDKNIKQNSDKLYCALFLFIRNYSYSGMFRYNDSGEFNVPYGGIAYNSKLMDKKLNYYKSIALRKHFDNTSIYNLDFEEFLKRAKPTKNDFVFLDPPYDSEFSTYAQNEFTKIDCDALSAL